MRTLIGLFQDSNEARETISDLQKLGARPKDISVVAPAGTTSQIGTGMQLAPVEVSGYGRVAACGPLTTYLSQATAQHTPDAIISALLQMGVPEPEASRYVEGVRQGYTLETVRIDDSKANQALQIMRTHALGGDGTQRTTGTQARGAAPSRGDTVLPVIVEELVIGKREVGAGGVRATTRVTETPVEEEVTLREEHVDVERRTVDRPVGSADATAFQDRTVEVVATSEEPVITKRARVIEEIVITKSAESRTETVRDTVRRTDVDVEPFDATQYREHYDTTYGRTRTAGADEDYDFASYQPAYKFGSEMRSDTRFSGDEWSTVEPRARTTWEERNPGTWDRFKGAVRHAWERAKT
jgi:uncharacterized protein (TIGR02271 family)